MSDTRPTRTQAIERFLKVNAHEDLANLYGPHMECQVNVAQDDGTRINPVFQGRAFLAFTNGTEQWKSFRIPRNAGTKPEYNDVAMSFNLELHVEAIGLTGWDWQKQVSRWVAYDFDAIVGHSDRHTRRCSDEELRNIEALLKTLPFVTLRYSTSGKGLHLYIFVNEIPTENHHVHAALARSILSQLSAYVGFDFSSKIDIVGGNMWIWHRKMKGTNGLTLIQQGGIFEDIPTNWRDHISVIKGNRRRILPQVVQAGTEESLWEEMTSQTVRVDLDEEHRRHINWLTEEGAAWYWDSERNMLVTHTYFLQKMHEELSLKGIFKTISQGTERGTDFNCYAFPNRKGVWSVRRFTPGVAEDPSWGQDGAGWTRCYLNREPDFKTLASSNRGKEKPDGSYQFDTAQQAVDTLVTLGGDVDLPKGLYQRKSTLKMRRDKRVVVTIERQPEDTGDRMADWIAEKHKWLKVVTVKNTNPIEPEIGDFDEVIRHMVTEDSKDAGWVIRSGNTWAEEPLPHLKMALKSCGHEASDLDNIMGNAVMKHWVLVNRPFQPEYPGGRTWNKSAAQLRMKPTIDKDTLSYPTWIKLLRHLGEGLDEEIKENPWCARNNVLTGLDYLMCWVGSLFQFPLEPLPYLFFCSQEQNTGKSSFHQAMSLLLTHGAVVAADIALTSTSGFSGELASAILCYIEEVDLGKGAGKTLAANRIKDWVTSKQFNVHPKGRTPYMIPNTTHWVQCSNNYQACPIFPGDTRITMIPVRPIEADELIPTRTLLDLLRNEGSDFLAAVLALEIPPSNDRLNVPVINTQIKWSAARHNQSFLEVYIAEECFLVDGEWVRFKDFYEGFVEWTGSDNAWTKHRVREELPATLAYGKSYRDNQRYIGNISYKPREGETKTKITVRGEYLYRDNERL